MSGKITTILAFLLMVLALCLVAPAAFAQSTKGQSSDQMKSEKGSVTATGCLQKGNEPGGYYLTDADGKTWELSSTSVNLSDHVGHQVSVTGSPIHESKSKEARMADDEKKEASGNYYADLQVTQLKMVSDSCKRPR